MEYLDFEKPIEDLINKINQAEELGREGKIDISSTISKLEKKLKNIVIIGRATINAINSELKNQKLYFVIN